jgi:hypothetical protein
LHFVVSILRVSLPDLWVSHFNHIDLFITHFVHYFQLLLLWILLCNVCNLLNVLLQLWLSTFSWLMVLSFKGRFIEFIRFLDFWF